MIALSLNILINHKNHDDQRSIFKDRTQIVKIGQIYYDSVIIEYLNKS
jgi:hypothetical protein